MFWLADLICVVSVFQCLTCAGLEVTRVALVDSSGHCVLDELVKPPNPIIDYYTMYTHTHTQRYSLTHRHTHTHTQILTHSQTHTHTQILTHRHTHRHTDTHSLTDTHRHTLTHTHMFMCRSAVLCVIECVSQVLRNHASDPRARLHVSGRRSVQTAAAAAAGRCAGRSLSERRPACLTRTLYFTIIRILVFSMCSSALVSVTAPVFFKL